MGPSDEIVKRAEDEAEVIKLIYGDAVVHCKTRDCWKQFQHLELRVRLGPSTTETAGSSVELDIVCPPLYPLEPPKIAILKPIGVTKTETAELLQRLNDRIGHVSGSELIYDLCMETQNFLRTKRTSAESNEETSGSRPPTSQLQPAAIRTTTRQNSVDSRQSVFLPEEEEPVEVRAEDEQKCRLEKTLKRIGPLGDAIKVELISKAGQVVDVSRILNSTVQRKPLHQFATEWLAWDGHRPVLVTEFRFEHKLLRRDKNVTNKLVAFEKSLRTFASHVLKHLSLPIDDEFLTTYLLLPRASGLQRYIELGSRTLGQEGVLQGLIKSSKSSLLPQLANHLICGLKSLHEGRVAHGALGLNTIWVRADNTFFLSDHHLLSDILHFCQSFAHITDDGDRKRRHSIHSLRLQDIRDFGRILTEISQRNKSLSVDQGCLDDFVAQCNLPDAHIQALSDHPFLYLSCPAIPSTEDGSASTFVPITSMKNSGRLLKEYHVISFLGRGGFGEVWLARNKLDSNNYAIKRIPLSGISWKQVERIKNEVLLFSKITDDHIVRYFSSWVESTTLERTESSSEPISQTISDDLSLLPSKLRDLEDEADGGTKVDQKKTDDSTTADSSSSSSSGGFGFFRGPHTTPPQAVGHHFDGDLPRGSDLSVIFADEKMDGRAVIPLYLCLQMEWCKYGTLRTLIDEGELYENSAMIWRICKETILGLDCLHRYKLIHR
ncbi:Non-specific serine/threonine protein kinase [Aphelenchoides fujianensis]|nr:Non-specific serine/threonine protein kinase [Aphelenchoides fujianensis]